MTRKTILFDLDGTLIDSTELIVDSYHHTFKAHGLPTPTREEIVDGIGTPLVAVFGKLSEDVGTIDQWIATYREYNLANHDMRVRVFPGVVDMVQQIHRSGRSIGIVTSKNHSGARRGLALAGLEEMVSVVIGADDVVNHKPHPEPVEKALTALGSRPISAAFIGDSHHDIASGKAAGVMTIAVTWGAVSRPRLEEAGPDRIVDAPEQILAAIGN